MKKILIFSLNYFPFVGGAEVAIKEITDRLPTEGFEFHVLAPHYDSNLPKIEQMGRVLVHRFGFAKPGATISDQSRYPLKLNKYWYQLRAASVASKLHAKYRYDAIWGMMAHATGIPAGEFKAKHPDVKYLLTLQEGDPPEYIEKLMKPVWKKFKKGFTEADALQAISTFLMSWGKHMGFTGEGRIIPNGVDTGRFSAVPDEAALSTLKRELGKKDGDIYLVTTSRLVHKNAVDDVIRALPFLPENVSFLVYGVGPDEAMLRALAEEQSVRERVRFMGQIGHEALPLTLAACDIFIRPSRSEGMGNSFIEAMAAGLPVIATQEGGIADFLFDEKKNADKLTTGWAVEKNSPEQIADAIEDILGRPEKVLEVTATAQTLVRTTYDWNNIAQDMADLFAVLLPQETIPPTPADRVQ